MKPEASARELDKIFQVVKFYAYIKMLNIYENFLP